MKNGKIFFLSLGVFVFLASGCSLFGGKDGSQPEAALPEDSLMVITFDHSDKDQRAKLKNLMEKFPENGLGKKLIEQYDAEVEDNQKFATLKPILKNEWKLAFGMKVLKEDLTDVTDEDFEYYLAGKFAEADKVEKLLESLEPSKEVDGLKTWGDTGGMIARQGEFFVVAQDTKRLKEAFERLDDEAGFKIEDKIAFAPDLAGGNLGYFYLNSENSAALVKALDVEVPGVGNSLKGFGDMYMTLVADKDDLRFRSRSLLDEATENPYITTDYLPKLISKVPGMDMMMFAEQGSMETILQPMFAALAVELKTNAEVEVLKKIAEFAKIEEAEAKAIIDSPVAVSISYVDQLYPAMMIYLDLEKEEVEAAKKFALAFDQYVDEIAKSFDELVAMQVENVEGALKKAPVVVKGGGMHKAYLDWSAFKEEDLAALNVVPGVNMKELDVELYYGVTGDNVMVFGLYPGFDKAYGAEVFADNEEFKHAEKSLGTDLGFTVSYFQTEPVLKLADKYFAIVQGLGMLKPQDEATYKTIRDSVATVRHIISTSSAEDKMLKGEGAIRIEAVK